MSPSYHSSYMLHGTGEDGADTACVYAQTKRRVINTDGFRRAADPAMMINAYRQFQKGRAQVAASYPGFDAF